MARHSPYSIKEIFTDIIFDIAGCGLLALGIVCFSSPNNIAPGGVGGISIMINYVSGIPISILTLALNIPLLVLAWIFLGHTFALKTIKSVMILTVEIEIITRLIYEYRGDMLLASLYGGAFTGVGLALVFMRSSTTGGTDVASRLIQLKFPNMSVGKLLLCVDGFVILASAIVYRNIENALYGVVSLYASSTIVDSMIYGLNAGKLMMIVTQKPAEISRAVYEELERGCTLLDGKGSFSNQSRPVVLCAVRNSQYFELKHIIYHTDPTAFMIALNAGEIIGEGFKNIEESTKAQ